MRITATGAEDSFSLNGHTLVVPGSGGLANVGELCIDALVSTFGLRRVAIVRSSHLLPAAMASAWQEDDSGSPELTTAAEIYQGVGAPNLSVLQIRSAVIDGRRNALAQDIWSWACGEGAAELVIVSSCSSHVKVDADFAAGSDLRYVWMHSAGGPSAESGLSADVLPLSHSLQEQEGSAQSRELEAVQTSLRSGGLAKPLLLQAAEAEKAAKSFPGVLCLLGMTTDILDWQLVEKLTVTTLNCLTQRLKVTSGPKLQPPPSWRYAVEALATPQRLWG